METSHFRAEINRMVRNYTVMGVLNEIQSDSILGVIDRVLPKPHNPPIKREGNIIYFPGALQEQKVLEPSKRQDPLRPELSKVFKYFEEQGINLSFKIRFALYNLGGYDLKTITTISARELKKYQGVGEKSIAKLRAFLQSKGFDLQE
jgi:hypothetical protein